MSLTGQIIDLYDDSNYSGLKKLGSAGSYGDTHILEPEEHQSLPDNQFGLIVLTKRANILRKFPLNDEGNVWLSAQYFDMNSHKLDDVQKIAAATNIKHACDAYEIDPPSSILKFAQDKQIGNVVSETGEPNWFRAAMLDSVRQELTKTASAEINARLEMPDNCYALVYDNDGEVIKKYAMPDENHVKIASAYFKKYAMDLNPEHRHQFASKVLNRATELEVKLDDTGHLEKWASPHYSEYVDWHIEQRKSLLPRDPDSCEVLDKLASLRDTTTPTMFAEALGKFDELTGLDRYYDRGIKDPWESTMGHEKTASWSEDIDGVVITEADLKKVASSGKLKSHFGETFNSQFQKNAVQIFESLPDPEKTIIKQMATGEI